MPTCPGIEHLSMTVPDLDEATRFFTGVFGCRVLYTMGPFDGSGGAFMRVYANADVRTVVRYVRVLRSPYLNIELFQVDSPVQRARWPDRHDIGGWSPSAHVDDMAAAVAWLEQADVYLLGEERPAGGRAADGGSARCSFMTRWGLHVDLVTRPDDGDGTAGVTHLRNRAAAGAGFTPEGGLPSFQGFTAVGMTVPDLDAATNLLVAVLGCESIADIGPPRNETGSAFGASANVDVRAAPGGGRRLRTPFLDLELSECPPYPGQERAWPGILDVGGWHLAVYVDDVDAALDHLAGLDVRVLGGKKPAYDFEAGDDACTVHCLAPFGFSFELVTYPHGRYRASDFAGPAWHPGHPG